MLPVPLAAMPIDVFELDHEIVAPATLLVNGIFTPSPGQNEPFNIVVTTGSGLTVILNVVTGPGQLLRVADTLMFATIGAPEIFVGAT